VAHAARRTGREATLFHRDPVRGQETAKVLGAVWGGTWDALRTERFAAVCNATPVRTAGEVPAGVLGRPWGGGAFLDLAYGAEPSGWETWVAAEGGTYIGGIEFLARQARGQLRRWTGKDVSLSELWEEAA
jgi:shikimate 5-dehydrogenase